MTARASTVHQVIGSDGTPHPGTGCFNLWIGDGPDVFAFPREGNRIIPLVTGKDYFADLIKACDAATDEVLILGWQVNWDALLAPSLRLYDLIFRCAARGVRFHVMPWDDSNPVQTYDHQTRAVLECINDRLGLQGGAKRVHVTLSKSFATKNNPYYSHHQKCVIVDRRIAYMGGIDLAYGRYDDATYDLRADAEGRRVLNRYNPCVEWVGPVRANEVTDPDLLVGAESPGTKARISNDIHNGCVQQPYDDNLPINTPQLEPNPQKWTTLDARIQPRMPWQDVHCRIEGPAVSDLVRNFVMRWNVDSALLLPLPAPPESWPRAGNAKIQVLRSAPANMQAVENKAVYKTYLRAATASTQPSVGKIDYQALQRPIDHAQRNARMLEYRRKVATPQRTDHSIQDAMLRLIDNAAHFIYIESQFFVSAFGAEAAFSQGDLAPAAMFINTYSADGKSTDQNATARNVIGLVDSDSHLKLVRNRRLDPGLDRQELIKPPTNKVCHALIRRIRAAILHSAQAPFHVYITLPVHPEGKLCSASIAVQVYWTMQTLVFGSHSLLNGIRRALKARELRDKKQPYQAVLDDPHSTAHEDIPLDACYRYVTLLNLRNWAQLGDRYVTEQIYVHSKLMIVDDRFALLGSANINDRSLLGERDSELAVLVMDNDHGQADVGCGRNTLVRGFARDLRMQVWKKLFGITGGVRPASHLAKAIEQPANPASWRAIQRQADENAAAYEKAFSFVPRNWTLDEQSGRVSAKILPTWNQGLDAPPNAKWERGNIGAPLPFQPAFWTKAQHNSVGVQSLSRIKGFISALPVHWTRGENIRFEYPSSLVTRNDQPHRQPPANTSPVLAQASGEKRA